MKIFLGILFGFAIGVASIALRATHFCHQKGFNDWDTKGCYKNNNIYEN